MKTNYSIVNNSVKIEGVDGTNPVIYCNDMFFDTPEGFYLWLKANRKEVNLVGNISTRNMHIPPNIKNSHESTWKEWVEAYDKAMAIGLKNIPAPIKGSDDYLRKPASGVIEQTQRKDSPGSDLIISEARKASAAKPLVIFDGGFVTSLANAYLKDNSISDKVVIIHIDGWDNTMHNGVDYWATEIVMKKFRYIDWHGSFINNQVTWYDPFRPLQVTLNMPVNPWTNLLKDNYYHQSYAQWKDLGDAPGALWFFDNSLWKNVVRRTANKQTTTSNTYDYLLVSDNDWPKYGPMLSVYMNNPTNYIPVTTAPPVNTPPVISILTSNTTYPAGSSIIITATASDDKAVSKVEFFNGSVKLGESLNSPYSWVINNAVAGTYNLTGKATDNEGASTVSSVRVVTVGEVVPPVGTTVTVGTTTTLQPGQPATVVSTPTPTGIALNFGIPQGIPGQNATGSGSQPRAYFVAAGAGDGITDDTNALQAWIDNVIKFNGFGILPSPAKFYKITRTLNMGPVVNQQSYAWFDIQGSGQPGYTIVYMGASNQPAIKMYGFKGGSIRGLRVKIGDGITGSACWDIGTMHGTTSNSTSGFSFYDCSVELNKGVNNVGFRIGSFGGAGDVSQIVWNNVTAWGGGGVSGASIPGQAGWQLNGNNALQFTWIGGSSSFADKAVELNAGGAMYFFGFGGSQNKVDFYLNHSNTLVTVGNRWESGKQHVVTTSRASHMSITETGSAVADYMPDNGRLYELRQPGTLILDGLKIEKRREINRPDFGSEMIYMESSGMGSLHVRGGAFHAAEPFYTLKNSGTWSINIEGVGKMDANYNSTTQFQNK